MLTSQRLFLQNVVAIIWDFDKTLIPGNIQSPLFNHYDIDEDEFWREVKEAPEFYHKDGLELVNGETFYLQHMLTYAESGLFPGLNNTILLELGANIDFCQGIPNFLRQVQDRVRSTDSFRAHEIMVEHYIVSTGLRQMILGSKIASYVTKVWACEFVESVPQPGYLKGPGPQYSKDINSSQIRGIGYSIDNTTKTRAVFEINKGTNTYPDIDVNSHVPYEDRRIPFQNMIYIADGPSDVPVFSVLSQYGGKTIGVYKPGDAASFRQVNRLQQEGRVQSIAPADYLDGSQAYLAITTAVDEIAERIVYDRIRALQYRVGRPPEHITGSKVEQSADSGQKGQFSPDSRLEFTEARDARSQQVIPATPANQPLIAVPGPEDIEDVDASSSTRIWEHVRHIVDEIEMSTRD